MTCTDLLYLVVAGKLSSIDDCVPCNVGSDPGPKSGKPFLRAGGGTKVGRVFVTGTALALRSTFTVLRVKPGSLGPPSEIPTVA